MTLSKAFRKAFTKLNINLPSQQDKQPDVISEDDLCFLRHVLPTGLTSHSMYYRAGNRYVTILIAESFPSYLADLQFADIFNKTNRIVTLDISYKPKNEAVSDVEKSINELSNRSVVNHNSSENINDSYEQTDLLSLHAQLQRTSENIAYTTLRFIVSADSLEDLDKRVKDLEDDLKVLDINLKIPENEMLSEYRSLQNSAETVRQPIPVIGTLERQFPFYFQSHEDLNGTIWGVTPTKGLAVIDPFLINGDRKSFDMLFIGKKGSGKSGNLKSLTQEQLSFGNKVLDMDVDGERIKFAQKLGGRIVSPTEKSGLVNVLQLRFMFSAKYESNPTQAKDEKSIIAANYTEEISRVMCFFYQWMPQMDDTQADMLNDILQITYHQRGITELTNLDGLTPKDFPIMADLLATIRDMLYLKYEEGNESEYRPSLSPLKHEILERLEIAIKPLAEGAYATIFNGYSTVDISKENYVVFDVSLLSEMEDRVFNAFYLNLMALMWGEVYINRVLNEGVPEDLQKKCICVWDESHRFINTRNPKGLEFMDKLLRRDRKYLAGLWFASQHPRDFAPSGSSEMLDKIKDIFSLVQYKVLMQQDSSDYDVIEHLFPEFTRSEIENTSRYIKGDMLISLGNGEKIRCHRYIPAEDLEYFGGGR